MDGVRIRHALRCGLGGCLLAFLGQAGATTGCISSVLFYISVIAGTPEYLQGFVLRSAFNTFYGAFASGVAFLLVVWASAQSRIAAFFLFLPLVVFFAAVRTDRALVPLPLVFIVLLGYFLISIIAEPNPRAAALDTARILAYEALLALAVSLATQSLVPDLARTRGTAILAEQVDAAGHALSNAASGFLSVVCARHPAADDDHGAGGGSVSRSTENGDWEHVAVPGGRRVENYTALARVRQLLDAAAYEPVTPCSRMFTAAYDPRGWPALLDVVEELLTKVSSIEAAVYVSGGRSVRPHFSREYVFMLLGEELVPVWVAHFAASAAACHGTSAQLAALTGPPGAVPPLHADLDARSSPWLARRSEMYQGFVSQFLSYWTKRGMLPRAGDAAQEASFDDVLGTADGAGGAAAVRGSELRSIIFVTVGAHAFSEVLARVQSSVAACRTVRWNPLGPLRMFWAPLPPLARRSYAVLRLRLAAWELRFVATHTAMLASIFAATLFVGALQQFKPDQVAWVFASAGLAAQLSVETTLFIGALRVAATVAGCGTAFGVTRLVRAVNRRAALFALGPYFGAITIAALLILPPKFRYASFLFVVTNALVTFCPRATLECRASASPLADACFPDWKYALTRCINVSIGVVLAVAFHSLLWPHFAQDSARRAFSQAFSNATQVFATFHRRYRDVGRDLTASGGEADTDGRPAGRHIFIDVLNAEDVVGHMAELAQMTQSLVRQPLSAGLLLLAADASVWNKGRLALPDVLKQLPEQFVTLSASLSEMGSVLRRRPMLSGRYRRTAHALFVAPLVYERETLIVSLFHLGHVVQHLLQAQTDPPSLDALQCSVRHLRMTLRVVQRRVADLRRAAHGTTPPSSALDGGASRGNRSVDEMRRCVSTGCIDETAPRERAGGVDGGGLPHVDDIVLYNAFSFSSNACIAAFLSIADVCERNIASLTHGTVVPEKEKPE
jgi:hypothetical protein